MPFLCLIFYSVESIAHRDKPHTQQTPLDTSTAAITSSRYFRTGDHEQTVTRNSYIPNLSGTINLAARGEGDSPSPLKLRRARLHLTISRWLTTRSSKSVGWWSRSGSNRRPPACKAGALPTELRPRSKTGSGLPKPTAHQPTQEQTAIRLSLRGIKQSSDCLMVGLGRLELPTSRLSSARSNQLSYRPDIRAKKTGQSQCQMPRPNKGSATNAYRPIR